MKSFFSTVLQFIWMLILSVGLSVLVVIICAALLVYIVFRPGRNEVVRMESPDHAIVATLMEINGGATTSFGYDARLSENHPTSSGKRVAYLYGAVRSRNAYGANLRWTSESELNIEYLSAQHVDLEKGDTRIGSRIVHISLKPQVLDKAAPAGGMRYNLERRPSREG